MRTACAFAVVIVGIAALVAGCGGGADGPPLVVVGTASGLAVLDGGTGIVGPPSASAVTNPGGELLARAQPIGTQTQVRVTEVAGADWWSTTVDSTLEPRTLSSDGGRIALVAPATAWLPGAIAPGRDRTEIAIVHDGGAVERYDVDGNIEPEAFSLDGTALFVIEYLPAEAPTSYRVRRLDLGTGEVGDVFSADAELQESMRGTARTQVWDPDGGRLYTLYQLQAGPEVITFVHVLDLEEQWAHCIDLPAGFAPGTAGMALAEGGDELYVADAASGAVIEVDTVDLDVARTATVAPLPGGSASVAVDDEAVFIGAGTTITRLDRGSLAPEGDMTSANAVVGLQRSPVANELFVAWTGGVVVLNADTGEMLRQWWIDSALTGGVVSLGGRAIPAYSGSPCAC